MLTPVLGILRHPSVKGSYQVEHPAPLTIFSSLVRSHEKRRWLFEETDPESNIN